MEHKIALGLGGEDSDANCGPAHESCRRAKDKIDVPAIAKAKRMKARHLGIKKRSTWPGGEEMTQSSNERGVSEPPSLTSGEIEELERYARDIVATDAEWRAQEPCTVEQGVAYTQFALKCNIHAATVAQAFLKQSGGSAAQSDAMKALQQLMKARDTWDEVLGSGTQKARDRAQRKVLAAWDNARAVIDNKQAAQSNTSAAEAAPRPSTETWMQLDANHWAHWHKGSWLIVNGIYVPADVLRRAASSPKEPTNG